MDINVPVGGGNPEPPGRHRSDRPGRFGRGPFFGSGHKNFEHFPVQVRKGSRCGGQAPDQAGRVTGPSLPVDAAVLFLQARRMRGQGVILALPDNGAGFRGLQRREQQVRPHDGQTVMEVIEGFLRFNRGFFLQKDVARIDAFVDGHDRHTRYFFVPDKGPVHGCRAAVPGQEGGVHIQAAQGRILQDIPRQDLSESRHHHGIGCDLPEGLQESGVPDPERLIDGQAIGLGQDLDR